MAYIVNMPQLGMEMEEGTVLEWTVDEGDDVEEGEVLAEIESEKSIGEVEAREDGVLRRIYVEVDETVSPGTPIGIVAGPGEDIGDLAAEAESELEDAGVERAVDESDAAESTAADSGSDEAAASEQSASAGQSASTTTGQSASAASADDVKASPRARKRAEELGVDLATVDGTGPQGSITADDVEAAASSSEAEDEGEAATASADVKASPRARKRAEELGVDLAAVDGTGPQGSVTADDVEAAAEAGAEAAPESGADAGGRAERIVPAVPERSRYARETAVLDAASAAAAFDAKRAAENAFDVDASVTDVLLVVLSAALREVPELNATFEEATHHLRESQHVALAGPSAEGDGLATAVVADLDEQSFTDLVAARQAVAASDDGGDEPAEGPAATFTVASATDFDDGAAGKLVNPPAVAALDVDAVGQRAVPAGNGVDLRPHVACGVTYDTRAVDADAVERFFDSLDANALDATDLVMRTYVE